MTGVHRDAILRLMVRAGKACAQLMDDEMQDLNCTHLELDEQWTFVGKNQCQRKKATANKFVDDLASRMGNLLQIRTDGPVLYVEAVERALGGNMYFAQIVKSYEAEPIGVGRYSLPRVADVDKRTIVGNPNMQNVSTSGVERLNLTTRMRCRRLTHPVESFSRKPGNLQTDPITTVVRRTLVYRVSSRAAG